MLYETLKFSFSPVLGIFKCRIGSCKLMATLLYSVLKVLLQRIMRTKFYVVVRLEISQETGYSKDGIDRYVLIAVVQKKKLTSCCLFTTTPLWHVVLLLPVCSSQAHGTISFLSLTVCIALVFFCPLHCHASLLCVMFITLSLSQIFFP